MTEPIPLTETQREIEQTTMEISREAEALQAQYYLPALSLSLEDSAFTPESTITALMQLAHRVMQQSVAAPPEERRAALMGILAVVCDTYDEQQRNLQS